MIDYHYLAGVAVALWASHQAFVQKEGTPHTAILALAASGVLAFGSLNTVRLSGGSEFAYASEAMAVLWTINALVAGLVVLTSIFGEYGESTPADPGGENVNEQQYDSPFTRGGDD